MDIRTVIRELEKHVKTRAATAAEQIAIISRAQGLTRDERHIAILSIVKNRIRRQAAR